MIEAHSSCVLSALCCLQFITVHFIAVAFLISTYISTHLAMSPLTRRLHYFYRFAHPFATLFVLLFAVPTAISLGRDVTVGRASEAQTAMFAGALLLCIGEIMNFLVGLFYFLSHPVFVDAYPPFTNRRVKGQARHHEVVAQHKTARRAREGDMVNQL